MPQANFTKSARRARSALELRAHAAGVSWGVCSRRPGTGALARLVEPSPLPLLIVIVQHVVDIRAAEGVHAVVGGTGDVVQVVVQVVASRAAGLNGGRCSSSTMPQDASID